MADFILVHGGLAGAWCWDLFRPELHRLGHTTQAMDLPIEDPDLTLEDYADAVIAATRDATEKSWLVGHSMGGLIIPRVALKKPMAGLIFLCAGLPARTMDEHIESYESRNPDNEAHFLAAGPGRIRLSFESAVNDFFHDCPEEMQRWAYSQFRSQATGPFSDFNPISDFPAIPMHAVITSDDAIVLKGRHTAMFRKRIGVEPVELPGSHCPFMSRPAELAAVVDRVLGQ